MQSIYVLAGIALVTCGSSALNQALERRSDAHMRRTAGRPMVTRLGQAARIGLAHGLMLGFATIVGGTAILLLESNILTGTLTLLTATAYVAIYTPLKRMTSLNTFIGAFPGALPPLIGWTAARGLIEWPAVALFAVLFVWQFPHFMAIGWLYREDYRHGGIKLSATQQPTSWAARSTVRPGSLLCGFDDSDGAFNVISWRDRKTLHSCGDVLSLGYLWYTVRFGAILRDPDSAELAGAGTQFAASFRNLSAAFVDGNDCECAGAGLVLAQVRRATQYTEIRDMPTLRQSSPAITTPLNIVVGLISLSITASAFLVWLVYFHTPADAQRQHLVFLPALNAVLNGLCTVALLFGFTYIWRDQVTRHRNAMFTAFFFSSLFLVSYITNHALHGDSHFHGYGVVRPSLLCAAHLPHLSFGRGAADDPDHVLLLVDGAVPAASAHCALYVSGVAVRFGHGRGCVCIAGGLPLSPMRPDTRKLLATGLAIFLTGAGAAVLARPSSVVLADRGRTAAPVGLRLCWRWGACPPVL